MKHDIDQLMAERNLDALVVFGDDGMTGSNAAFAYVTGGANMTGMVVKRRGEPARLIYHPMEQEAAEGTGLALELATRWDSHAFLQQHGGDPLAGLTARLHQILVDLGATGRVAFYGVRDAGKSYAQLSTLNAYEDVEVVGEFSDDVLSMARMTKDPAEAAAIRATSALTGEVVAATLRFLQSHRVGPDETLLQADGAVLTVKDVKAFVNRELAGRELEATEGFIFALAADAGVGHSAGKPNDVLRVGIPIVFDIFPRSRNGYYTDLTRTFCLDYAPAAVAEAYAQVRELFEQVLAALAAGELASRYQEMTCDYFEAHGHRSVRQDRATTIGYTHSLGHGVGLQVHENPLIATIPGRTDRLIPGAVFTIEPGLYYPECGFGVRLEDTVYCDPAGTFHRLTEFPYDLLVPMS